MALLVEPVTFTALSWWGFAAGEGQWQHHASEQPGTAKRRPSLPLSRAKLRGSLVTPGPVIRKAALSYRQMWRTSWVNVQQVQAGQLAGSVQGRHELIEGHEPENVTPARHYGAQELPSKSGTTKSCLRQSH